MSAGTFQYSRYERNDGAIQRIRIQPETLGLTIATVANDPPTAAIDTAATVYARGSRRRFGVTARKISVLFTGTLPDGYSGDPVEVPILTPAFFNTITAGATGTYLTVPIEVLSVTAEQVR